MSDDFSICNNCGAYDAGGKSIEQMKFDLIQSIFETCVDKQNEKFENEIEPVLSELLEQYIQLEDAERNGLEGQCDRCNCMTTFMTHHIEYLKEPDELGL